MEEIKGDKLKRILGIYTKLLNGAVVNKEEEAANYGVNKRSIQRDIEEITETLKENGIHEFTISSTFSNLIPTLALFEKYGYTMAGLTEVRARYTDFQTGKRAIVPAIRMRYV